MYYPSSRYKCPHISPQIINNTEKKKKDERNMNDSLTLPTQFPDEEIEGRSSCTSSPSPASLGTAALTLRARPLGTAPCHLLEHPSGKEKHQMQENLGSHRQVPEVPKERGPRPGDLRGMMDALQAVGMSSPRAGVSVGTDLLLTQH